MATKKDSKKEEENSQISEHITSDRNNNNSFAQHIKNIQSGKINIVDFVENALQQAQEYDKKYHCFTTICREEALAQAREIQERIKHHRAGKLAGLLVTVKDNVCVKDVESTASSRILKGYKPLFDATVIKRLKKEDAIIIGKTVQEEFGFGSFGTNVGLDYIIPLNPLDVTRATGGSSGGAGVITAVADFPHVAVAETTGGSIESPAAFCGVVGFCPTYGRLSRYGLISYADSLDKIGFMSRRVEDILPLLEISAGRDEMDGTSLSETMRDFPGDKQDKKETEKLRIGVITEAMGKGIAPSIIKAMQTMIEKLKRQGMIIEDVSLPLTFKYGIPTYYILSTTEASTNLARFCGLRYGEESSVRGKTFSDYFSEIRNEHFNAESKRRIILGTFARMAGYREAYYLKVAKVRTKIIEEYDLLFKRYDVLISPTMPITAPTFSEIKKLTPLQNYMMDILTVGPNLAGIPHASISIGEEKQKKGNSLPIGMMAMTKHHEEKKLLFFLSDVEKLVAEDGGRK